MPVEKAERRAPTGLAIPQKILAILFLAFLFYIGLDQAHHAMDCANDFAKEGNLIAYGRAMNKKYTTDFLEFKGDWLSGRGAYINLNGLMARLMGQRHMNNVFKLDGGYLLRESYATAFLDEGTETALQASASAIKRLSERMDGRYVYVQTPYKVREHDPLLPAGIEDTLNEPIDRFLACLTEDGVDVMDLRKMMEQDGIRLPDAFFRTDHHWLPETGFYAFQKIADSLFDKWGIESRPPAMDLANYDIENYPMWHMGSEGVRVGPYYSEYIDDFHLITPRFDTLIERVGTHEVGGYEDLLIDRSPLQARDLWDRMTYDVVYGRCTDAHFRNLAEDAIDKKVLIIMDSLGKVVAPFWVLTCKETLVTTNLTGGMTNITEELLEAFRPDYIIDLRFPPNAVRNVYRNEGNWE
jgi:hypothetical protein